MGGDDQHQRPVVLPDPAQAADQRPEAAGVDELDLTQVGDEVRGALGRQVLDLLPDLGRGVDVDLAGDAEHRAAVALTLDVQPELDHLASRLVLFPALTRNVIYLH